MKFLITLLLLAGALAGGGYYFFKGTVFYERLFSAYAAATEDESVRRIYARKLKASMKEYGRDDYPALRDYYLEAAAEKYAVIRQIGGVSRQRYAEIKRQEYDFYIKTLYDSDSSGDVTREEWPQNNLFRFVALDADRDDTLSYDELWQGVAAEVAEEFSGADRNGDNQLDEQEYIRALESSAARIARATDKNSNTSVSPQELEVAEYEARRHWQP